MQRWPASSYVPAPHADYFTLTTKLSELYFSTVRFVPCYAYQNLFDMKACLNGGGDIFSDCFVQLDNRFKSANTLYCLHQTCPPTPLNFSTKAAIFWKTLCFLVKYCGFSGLILGRIALSSVPFSLAYSRFNDAAI